MKSVYGVIFTQTNDEKDTILVEVPDLEILTEGYGMADAIAMARDAIGIKGITMEDMGKKLQPATPIEEIRIDIGTFKDCGSTIISAVDIDFSEYRRKNDNKTVRRNVTLPNWLNLEAEKAQLNVSKVLQEALMTKLGVSR